MTPTSVAFLFLVLALLFSQLMPQNFCNAAPTLASCIPTERDALLDFKQGLVNADFRLSSWRASNREDCCKWEGITCNNLTGHIVKLDLRNPHPGIYYRGWVVPGDFENIDYRWILEGELKLYSLTAIKYLEYLDLSANHFVDYNTSLHFLGSFHHLRYLNLSSAGIIGWLTPHLGNLTKLQYLDLGSITFPYAQGVEKIYDSEMIGETNLFSVDFHIDWISRMSSLKYINMNGVFFESPKILKILNMIPSITEIHLQFCGLPYLPSSLSYVNFTSLSVLDLSRNEMPNSTIPSWLFNISSLEYLYLNDNNFLGYIPPAIENLAFLKSLDLSLTNLEFQGVATLTSVGKLCQLESLTLALLNISLDLSELVYMFNGCIKTNLEALDLYTTNVKGHLPDWLWDLRRLKSLDLSYNLISKSIPASIGTLSLLEHLDFSFNQLNGTVPENIGLLTELNFLDLSGNALGGVMSESHFDNLTKLKYLALDENFLSIHVRGNWSAQFKLQSIFLDSCYLGPQFPTWLRDQESALDINIANTGIIGPLPDWFPRFISQVQNLFMFNNQISGRLPDLTHLENLQYLDLASNHFHGPLPNFPLNTQAIFLSNNSFSSFGQMTLFLCQFNDLMQLDLSGNQLVGQIPDCWNNSPQVGVLDFSNNKYIHGEIPKSIGNLYSLIQLSLNGNSLSGMLPSSMSNCKKLIIIEVGNNSLRGKVPAWIGPSFENLLILKLGSNAFSGSIPPSLAGATKLHILDLSNNNLSGSIPQSFGNFTGMKNKRPRLDSYQENFFPQDEIPVLVKGEIMVYGYKIFGLLFAMDLSGNHLSGSIPKELTSLSGLLSLNLSRNHLTGEIPTEISNLTHLESLDLSMNDLSGSIPSTMNGLTYLSDLNLSNNNLSGEIPQGNQMLTFNASSYEGNPRLCGLPLVTPCTTNRTRQGQTETEDAASTEIIWIYASAALGFIVSFWSVCGVLLLKRKWRASYFHFIDNTYDDIYVFLAVKFSFLRRRT